MEKGYYSIVQYCPDQEKDESVNIGVLLFCPESQFIDVKIANSNQRISKFFGRKNIDVNLINASKIAIENRIKKCCQDFQDYDDLNQFILTRANDIRLTQARWVKVFEPENTLSELFLELVGGKLRQAESEKPLLFKNLEVLFKSPDILPRVRFRRHIPIFETDVQIFADYSYRNGHLTAIREHTFPTDLRKAIEIAKPLALDSDLLFRKGITQEVKGEMVVIGNFPDGKHTSIISNIREFLAYYNGRLFTDQDFGDFEKEIRGEVQPLLF